MQFIKNRINQIAMLLVISLLTFFWLSSRYPALNDKAAMVDRTSFQNIAFDILVPVNPDSSSLQRGFISFINWSYTNWKGMFFGLLLASAVMIFERKVLSTRNTSFLRQSFKGFSIGTPLGVCANCATPVASGLLRSGVSPLTALSTLISSPSFNIIVITMLIENFSFLFATLKLGLSALLVFIILPLLYHFSSSINFETPSISLKKSSSLTWKNSFLFVAKNFTINFFHISKIHIPLMIASGLLACTLVELIPPQLIETLPTDIFSLSVIAFIGTLLPVPIAFDVIAGSSLISMGSPPSVVFTVVFVLGSFSIYPFLFLYREVSKKLAFLIFFSVMLTGALGGLLHSSLAEGERQQTFQNFYSNLNLLNQKQILKAKSFCSTTFTSQTSSQKCEEILIAEIAQSQPMLCSELVEKHKVIDCLIRSGLKTEHIASDICPNFTWTEECEFLIEKIERLPEFSKICAQYANVGICKELLRLSVNMRYNDVVEYCRNNSAQSQTFQLCQQAMLPVASAIILLDPKKCLTIEGSLLKQLCLISILETSPENLVETTPSYCSQLNNTSYKEKCLSIFEREKRQLYQNTSNSSTEQVEHCAKGSPRENFNCLMTRGRLELQKDLLLRPLINPKEKPQSRDSLVIQTGLKEATSKIPQMKSSPFPIENTDLEINQFSLNPRTPQTKSPWIEMSLETFVSRSFIPQNFIHPYSRGLGAATGDVNNDGFIDILVVGSQKIVLLVNQGHFKFTPVPIKIVQSENTNLTEAVLLTAFVDIDNNGWLDIFVAGYGGNSFFIINDKKLFSEKKLLRLPQGHKNTLTRAAAFADIDGNGFLDVYLGNSFSILLPNKYPAAQNVLFLTQPDLTFKQNIFENDQFTTTSVLFSDFSGDGKMDLAVANDFVPPDRFFTQGPDAVFSALTKKMVPSTGIFSMSWASADINNDLRMDLFGTDAVTFGNKTYSPCLKDSTVSRREECREIVKMRISAHSNSIPDCKGFTERNKNSCFVTSVVISASKTKMPSLCLLIPLSYPYERKMCFSLSYRKGKMARPSSADLPQLNQNHLLINSPTGFVEKANEWNVHSTAWAWNASFADLNNDGWQDLFIATGNVGYPTQEKNYLFFNNKGTSFVEQRNIFEQERITIDSSFAYADFDNDGDIDIFIPSFLESPRILINQVNSNNSICFSLRDKKTNRQAVGAKLFITSGPKHKKMKQMREIKLSGGYMSYDSLRSCFGIERKKSIDRLEIIWPDGVVSKIDQIFEANKLYNIMRKE